MNTGEFHSKIALHPELEELEYLKNHASEQLRYVINRKVGEVLEEYQGKEVILFMEPVDTPPPPEIISYNSMIEYTAKFTAVLLNWQDAEVGDCVHTSSIGEGYWSDGSYAYMPNGSEFAWEGKWWKRTE